MDGEVFNVFGQKIPLDIDDGADGIGGHHRQLPCVRSEPELKFRVFSQNIGDGERDPINGDAAFVDAVTQVWHLNAQNVILSLLFHMGYFAGAVNMSGNEMTTHPGGRKYGTLEIAGRTGGKLSEGSDSESLGEEVETGSSGGYIQFIHRETTTIHGNGVSQREL